MIFWSYLAAGIVFVIGLAAVFLRGQWKRARGFDRLLIFGPVLYAAPLAAFGAEHFTLTEIIGSLIPSWIPWHTFWTYAVGAGFILAALSLATEILPRLAASLLAGTFFLLFVTMDMPAWVQDPGNLLVLTIALRQLAFCGGALALAGRANVARFFLAIPLLFYAFQQFRHGDRVPGVPLEPPTPDYVIGHAIWTYVTAVVYTVGGVFLLAGKQSRAAATAIGLTLVFIVLIVYVPIAVVERASLAKGLNYLADTLLFCGAVLALARELPAKSKT